MILGLRSSYVDDREVRQQIQHVLGLPFVPLDDVIDVFNDVMEDDLSDAVLEVYEYFEKNILSGYSRTRKAKGCPTKVSSGDLECVRSGNSRRTPHQQHGGVISQYLPEVMSGITPLSLIHI